MIAARRGATELAAHRRRLLECTTDVPVGPGDNDPADALLLRVEPASASAPIDAADSFFSDHHPAADLPAGPATDDALLLAVHPDRPIAARPSQPSLAAPASSPANGLSTNPLFQFPIAGTTRGDA